MVKFKKCEEEFKKKLKEFEEVYKVMSEVKTTFEVEKKQ